MKKRMLITAIVMVVVLAVALTTSSLAWFSATQNDVTAANGTFTAATQSAENVNIAISKTTSGYAASCDLDKANISLMPVALKSQLNFDTESKISFNSAKVTGSHFDPSENMISVSGDINLNDDDGSTDAAKSNAYAYRDTVYLVNYDSQNALAKLTIKLDTTLTAAAEKTLPIPVVLLKVSRGTVGSWTNVGYIVFVLDSTTNPSANYTVYDFVTNMQGKTPLSKEVSTSIVNRVTGSTNATGTLATKNEDGSFTASNDFIFEKGLAVNATEICKIDVVMWFDGEALSSGSQGAAASFNLTFTGSNA